MMEAAYAEAGKQLPHLIGPGMGHAYHPDTRREVLRRLEGERLFLLLRLLRLEGWHVG